jgi:glycosyltransferase involved in cell wall biosynthesis
MALQQAKEILHLIPSLQGGAGRAATRIHLSLLRNSSTPLQTRIRCLEGDPSIPGVMPGYPTRASRFVARVREKVHSLRYQRFRGDPTLYHSSGYPGIGCSSIFHPTNPSVVHLHWCGGHLLSIEDIGRIQQPILWTLHDQWAFCGAEHYASSSRSGSYRYLEGYTTHNRPLQEQGPDLNRHTWERKKRSWKQPFQIIAPSRWLAESVRQSALMGGWPVEVIPHPIDTDQWAPLDRNVARQALRLPQDKTILLFGVDMGSSNPNKGAQLMLQALHLLWQQTPDPASIHLVVFGQRLSTLLSPYPFTYQFLGRLHDDVSLRLAYSAADLLVMPSRVEAFGLTAAEAHACGLPVVAFNTTGLKDIIADHRTGRLADPFDPASLAACIDWVLSDPERTAALGKAARQRAENTWAESIVSEQYIRVYQKLMR